MAQSSRGRRPATTRRTAGRRASRPVAADPVGSHVVYTPRAIVLGMAFVAVLMLVAVPGREWLAQRAEIKKVESGLNQQKARVAELDRQAQAFNDPKQVEQIARDRLHYTFPGQTNVVVNAPPATAALAASRHGRAQVDKAHATWYSKLWSSTVSASQ